MVDDAVSRFRAQAMEQSTTPALVAFRKHVFDILDDEIEAGQAPRGRRRRVRRAHRAGAPAPGRRPAAPSVGPRP
ncbi:hypothetical protein Q9Q99_13400 [Curtobacterium flaccumfaciens]|nr:hypothetical protein Q9Q99_13400 [Curtobacterium flaccumfaciens]